MPAFTETKTLQSIEIFPALNVINVRHLNTTLRDGVKFNEQTEAKSYSTAQFSDFEMEVAPTGGTLADIVAGFSEAALNAASELPATLAAHAAALAAKDATIASLQAQIDAYTPPAPSASITRAQAKLALLQAGLLDAVQPAIDAITDSTQRRAAQIEWDDRLTFERTSGVLTNMATLLGMDGPQIDDLFALAATL